MIKKLRKVNIFLLTIFLFLISACTGTPYKQSADFFYELASEPLLLSFSQLKDVEQQSEIKALVEEWFAQVDDRSVMVFLSAQQYRNPEVMVIIDNILKKSNLVANQLLLVEEKDIENIKNLKNNLIISHWKVGVSDCEIHTSVFNNSFHSSQYACASKNNLARMVYSKSDLYSGRQLEMTPGIDAVSAVEAVNSGRSVPLRTISSGVAN